MSRALTQHGKHGWLYSLSHQWSSFSEGGSGLYSHPTLSPVLGTEPIHSQRSPGPSAK